MYLITSIALCLTSHNRSIIQCEDDYASVKGELIATLFRVTTGFIVPRLESYIEIG
jgi:hypothetical protein